MFCFALFYFSFLLSKRFFWVLIWLRTHDERYAGRICGTSIQWIMLQQQKGINSWYNNMDNRQMHHAQWKKPDSKGHRLIWVTQALLSLEVPLNMGGAVPDPLSGERNGLIVLLPVEHGRRHAYHAAFQPHRVAFGNSTVLQFLQDNRCFLHLFSWNREGPFLLK